MFTVKCDGTRDKNNVENFSIVLRFVYKGKLHEYLLEICELGHDQLDVASISSKILEIFASFALDPKSLISQCYDGAAVMSGERSGVQRRLQDVIGEEIPFVHCFNHQVHLVITNALRRDDNVRRVFEICDGLYNFTRRPLIAQHYDGKRLQRLLQQRWTGHLVTISTIKSCYPQLLELLNTIALHPKSSGSDVAEAVGYSRQMQSVKFQIIVSTLEVILLVFKPINAMLQSKDMDLSTALPLLDTAVEAVHAMRNDDTFEKIWGEISTTQEPPEPKRLRRESAVLAEYVIESSTSASHTGVAPHEEMRRIFTSIVDQVNAELTSRFSERTMEFVKSINVLNVKDGDFLNIERLQPLLLLLQRRLNLEDLKAELPIAKSFIRNKLVSQGTSGSETCMKQCLIWESLYHYREAFPQTYALFTAAVTFGASTAVCENAFSTLTRILTPARRLMLQSRMTNLGLLSCERVITSSITSDELFKKFRSRPRRLIV